MYSFKSGSGQQVVASNHAAMTDSIHDPSHFLVQGARLEKVNGSYSLCITEDGEDKEGLYLANNFLSAMKYFPCHHYGTGWYILDFKTHKTLYYNREGGASSTCIPRFGWRAHMADPSVRPMLPTVTDIDDNSFFLDKGLTVTDAGCSEINGIYNSVMFEDSLGGVYFIDYQFINENDERYRIRWVHGSEERSSGYLFSKMFEAGNPDEFETLYFGKSASRAILPSVWEAIGDGCKTGSSQVPSVVIGVPKPEIFELPVEVVGAGSSEVNGIYLPTLTPPYYFYKEDDPGYILSYSHIEELPAGLPAGYILFKWLAGDREASFYFGESCKPSKLPTSWHVDTRANTHKLSVVGNEPPPTVRSLQTCVASVTFDLQEATGREVVICTSAGGTVITKMSSSVNNPICLKDLRRAVSTARDCHVSCVKLIGPEAQILQGSDSCLVREAFDIRSNSTDIA